MTEDGFGVRGSRFEEDDRERLLAVLERIAVALEEANAADPVRAALAVVEAEEAARLAHPKTAPLPAEEGWRLG